MYDRQLHGARDLENLKKEISEAYEIEQGRQEKIKNEIVSLLQTNETYLASIQQLKAQKTDLQVIFYF